ncbi:hypothetical protein [Rhodoluna sp.]|uniref:hypothetical protein n=1 Tax=Rhodoluna sp. TaxID=1969481 RepID=UPI0025F47E76|nr:hypothetical protein [Rhodoluna sp.]
MTKRAITPRTSLSAAIDNAAGPIAVSNRVLIQFAFPSITGLIALNLNRFIQNPTAWFAISLSAYIATVIPLLIFRSTIAPTQNRTRMRLRTSIAFLIAGLIRGFVVFVVGTQLGVIPAEELLLRLLNAPLFVYGAVATFAIFNASRLRHLDTLQKLEIEKATLDELRGGIRERIKMQKLELLQRIQTVLKPAIEDVSKQISKKSKGVDVSSKLQNIVETVVRPLSHDVGLTDEFEAEVKVAAKRAVGAGFKQNWPGSLSVGQMIVAPYITFATASVALGFLAVMAPNHIALAGFISLAVVYLGFEAISRLLVRVWLPAFFAFITATIAATIPPVIAVNLMSFALTPVPFGGSIQFVMFSWIITWISFYMQFLRTQRAAAEAEMTSAIAELAILNSQLRQAAWMNRRKLAAILHGSVQSALYAAAIKLAKADKPTKKEIKAIQEDISASVRKLEQADGGESLSEVIEQIQQVWAGAVNITVSPISNELKITFEKHPIAASCVAEVIREAVSNSAKHGKANNIQISVRENEAGLIAVEVSNDGKPVAVDCKPGYGSSIFDEVAFSWSLKTQGPLTVLVASIAI